VSLTAGPCRGYSGEPGAPSPVERGRDLAPEPVGIVTADGLAGIVLMAAPDVLAALALTAAVDLIVRWRRSAGVERQ
jgi:hypothetical protein